MEVRELFDSFRHLQLDSLGITEKCLGEEVLFFVEKTVISFIFFKINNNTSLFFFFFLKIVTLSFSFLKVLRERDRQLREKLRRGLKQFKVYY